MMWTLESSWSKEEKEMKKQKMKVEGFSRVQIGKDGQIQGDSGWVGPNQITNKGFELYLCKLLASTTGSLQVN